MAKKSIIERLSPEQVDFYNELSDSIDKDVVNDPGYKKAMDMVGELYEKLEALVPEDKAKEFFDLMDEYNIQYDASCYILTLHVQHKTFKIGKHRIN
jgi:hypothetical protein